MNRPAHARTILTLLVASALVITAALARASEAPGSLCLAPQTSTTTAPVAAPSPAIHRLQERVEARFVAGERAARRAVERVVEDGEVVTLELHKALAAIDRSDRHFRLAFDRTVGAAEWEWHGQYRVCRSDDGPVTGAMDALVVLAKAPARGIDLALDAVVGVVKTLPTILRALV